MAQLNFHPAPGLGDLLPGFYVVPQNPIDENHFHGVSYVPRIGDILPGCFVVPQNPIKDYLSGIPNQIAREPGAPSKLNGKSVGISGCGGGCGGSCGCGGGVGDISADIDAIGTKMSAGDFTGAMTSPIFGIPLWGVAAGVVAGLMLMGGGRRHR